MGPPIFSLGWVISGILKHFSCETVGRSLKRFMRIITADPSIAVSEVLQRHRIECFCDRRWYHDADGADFMLKRCLNFLIIVLSNYFINM